MKNKSKLALELFITFLVATLLSSTISLGIGAIARTLGQGNPDTINYINVLAAVSWGLYVGYKVDRTTPRLIVSVIVIS